MLRVVLFYDEVYYVLCCVMMRCVIMMCYILFCVIMRRYVNMMDCVLCCGMMCVTIRYVMCCFML